MSAEIEAIIRNALYILGCGMLGGFIRYLKHSSVEEYSRIKLLAGLMSSCLCSLGGFAIAELSSLPFSAASFLMILLAFFDGRLLEALDGSLVTILEDGSRAIINILEHRGTKQ